MDPQGEDTTVKLENTNMQASEVVDSSILGKYSTWKKENDNKNQDSTIRLMRDQIIMARIYLSISKKKKKLDLSEELQMCIKRSRRVLGEANIDAELQYRYRSMSIVI